MDLLLYNPFLASKITDLGLAHAAHALAQCVLRPAPQVHALVREFLVDIKYTSTRQFVGVRIIETRGRRGEERRGEERRGEERRERERRGEGRGGEGRGGEGRGGGEGREGRGGEGRGRGGEWGKGRGVGQGGRGEKKYNKQC